MQPIIFIGGMGGSGTRAIARTMENLGYYAGAPNDAGDQELFRRLFMRPGWLKKGPGEKRIINRLKLYADILTNGVRSKYLQDRPRLADFAESLGQGFAGVADCAGWMTKLPSSHFYIEQIFKCWPEAVFIYLTRHPLDMAFSDNRFQLTRWGWFFHVDVDQFASLPAAQLEYWIRSEKRLSWLQQQYRGRIYALRFEDFTKQPVEELRTLLQALRLPIREELLAPACSHVAPPSTKERYRSFDLSQFSAEQLAYCRAAGWPIAA